ncbi:hypothetical protein [Cellulomonas alba]|uniref:Uncharacterized protein n=1 Tax=Cellulomonas alba TaxID=3053467 RepID=A0ABT7SG09_9CELL|nr:hypothetical protein [Cellulomonas alba]MDM7855108.1 hypothetical protein [Cellulomonas alba]
MTIIEGYTLTLPDRWQSWRPGEGAARADEIAAALGEGEQAQARVREAVLAFDGAQEGMVVENGIWVPDPSSGEALGRFSIEVLVAPPGQYVTAEEYLRSAQRKPRQRGVKVFHYEAVGGETPAGPAVLVTHTIAPRRGGQVVISAEWTVFPPGADESLQLLFTTPISAVADALGEQSVLVVNGLDVTVGAG